VEFAKLRRKFKIWRVLENSRTGGFKKGLRIGRFRELDGELESMEEGWRKERV